MSRRKRRRRKIAREHARASRSRGLAAAILSTIRKTGRCTRRQDEALMRMCVSVPPGVRRVP